MSPATLLVCFFAILSHTVLAEPEECKPKENLSTEMCCKVPNLLDDASEIKAIKEFVGACMDKVKDNKELASAKGNDVVERHSECVQECIVEKAGALKGGKLDLEMFKQLMFEFLGKDEAWKSILDNGAKVCGETAMKNVTSDAVCKSGTFQLSMCLMKDLYLNCPGKLWTDSPACKEEKALVEKCSIQTLMGLRSSK